VDQRQLIVLVTVAKRRVEAVGELDDGVFAVIERKRRVKLDRFDGEL